jgi:uncharacterized membrane protein YhhN
VRRTLVKAGSTALLAALAFEASGPLLLVAALGLSALGDAALAQEKGPVAHGATPTPIPSPRGGGEFAAAPPRAEPHGGVDFFFVGLAAFLLAQIAYAVLFLQAGAGIVAFTTAPWLAVIALAAIVFAGGMLALVWYRVDDGLRLPVAAYTVALLAMVLSALTIPSLQLIVGALLFMASDALLAWGKFLAGEDRHPAAAVAGWMLYYAAQLLITLAVVT